MNPNFRKTSQDSKSIRKQYLAGLALEASNNQKNQNANLIYKSTGATPTQAQDLRGTTEKYAGEMGAKQLIVDTLAGANILNAITASTAIATMNGEDIEFFHKYKDFILSDFKGKNVPASVFVDYLRRLREKTNATHGVEFNLQQDVGQQIVSNTASLLESFNARDEIDAALKDLGDNGGAAAKYAKVINKYLKGVAKLKPTADEVAFLDEAAGTELAPETAAIRDLFSFACSAIPGDLAEQIEGITATNSVRDATRLIDQVSPAAIREHTDAAIDARGLLKKLRKKFDALRPAEVPPEPEEAAAAKAEDPADLGRGWFDFAFPPAAEEKEEMAAPYEEKGAPSTTASENRRVNYERFIRESGEEGFISFLDEFIAKSQDEQTAELEVLATAAGHPELAFVIEPNDEGVTPLDEANTKSRLESLLIKGMYDRLVGVKSAEGAAAEPKKRPSASKKKPTLPVRRPAEASVPPLPPRVLPSSALTEPEPGGAPPGESGRGMRGRGIGRRKKTAVERSDGFVKPTSYKQFGRYLVNHHKLNDGILMIKSPSGAGVKEIPTEAISHRLSVIMKHMAMGQKPPLEDYDRLNAEEKSKLHKITKHSRVEGYGIPNPHKSSDESEMDRFSILRGEIVAGNDSSVVAKEFKMLLMKFMREGRVPRRQGNEILEELLRMGQ